MCNTCECGGAQEKPMIYRPGSMVGLRMQKGTHTHEHLHVEHHHISLEKEILHTNDKQAERNRLFFEARNIFAINMVSSPGAGKTSLLEQTLLSLSSSQKCYVIEGDQQTDNDAQRILQTGVDVIQVNTGNGCHLDAYMVNQAVHQLNPAENSLLFIENVGNLVCPSLFDLGEQFRAIIFSITEGEDKPLKYPNIFHSSHLVIINKIDLMPYLEFDLEKAKSYVQRINPKAKIFELSVKNRTGMEQWLQWISNRGK